MDSQFIVDVPRIVVFIDNEWLPSGSPIEVWDKLLEIYNNVDIVLNASECCKQQFLASYYIQERIDIDIDFNTGEELLSGTGHHTITINSTTGNITVKKDFLHSLILETGDYVLDHCFLTIEFDPYRNKETYCKWTYIIHDMGAGPSLSKSRILTTDKFSE